MDLAQIIYTIMAIVGFVIIAFSFIFDHDGDADHDVGHDVDGGDMSPSVFSLKVIAFFLMGFGLGAHISHSWVLEGVIDDKLLLAADLVAGLIFGFFVGWIGWMIIKIFLSQQATSVYRTEKFIGQKSSLRLGIVPNGIGELMCEIDGVQRMLDVRSEKGQAISKGTLVEIVSLEGCLGVVRPAN